MNKLCFGGEPETILHTTLLKNIFQFISKLKSRNLLTSPFPCYFSIYTASLAFFISKSGLMKGTVN